VARRRRAGSAPPTRRFLAPRVESERAGVEIHESLYADAKVKRRHMVETEAALEKRVQDAATAKMARSLKPDSFHRLCYGWQQKEAELEALREYLHRHEDPVTGRPLYRPKITRGPRSAGIEQGEVGGSGGGATGSGQPDEGSTGPVGLQAHLSGDPRLITGEAFHSARVGARRSRVLLQEENRQKSLAEARLPSRGAFTSGQSATLVRQMREKRLREMFTALDESGEGVIDGSTIEAKLPSLPTDIAEALHPFLSSFDGEMLAFTDFKTLVGKVLDAVAPPGPREFLLPARGGHSVYSQVSRRAPCAALAHRLPCNAPVTRCR
jgi:hypothetical protein